MCVAATRVSFDAQNLQDYAPKSGDTLVFEDVKQNVGGGYNASSGVFTAPRAGTYVVLATLQGVGRKAGASTVRVGLYQDGVPQQVVNTQADRQDADWDSTSVQAELGLGVGSRVWLQAEGDQNRLYGGLYCTFSGVLITPDP